MAIALPDLDAAIMLYTRECTELVTMVGSSSRIFLEWPSGPNKLVVPTTDNKFLNCVLIQTGKGGAGQIGSSLIQERVDFKCYGANKLTAKNIARLIVGYFCPQLERTKTSFTRANCRVLRIEQESTGIHTIDPDAANWPYSMPTLVFTYSGVPAS